jgi:ABC-type Fe3+ transport system permease subunit
MIDQNATRAKDDPGRNESEAERSDRNLGELLQELRVAALGVQVLFGFLLSLPFTVRFVRLSHPQRGLYITSLLLAAAATALLCCPVAYHRLVFRRHEKERLLRVANRLALLGLGAVGLAISTAVLLVVSFVERGALVPVLATTTVTCFAALWFAFPILHRRP